MRRCRSDAFCPSIELTFLHPIRSVQTQLLAHMNINRTRRSLHLRIANRTIEVNESWQRFPFRAPFFPNVVSYLATRQSLIVQQGVGSSNIVLREKLSLFQNLALSLGEPFEALWVPSKRITTQQGPAKSSVA